MIIPIVYPSAALFWINNDFSGSANRFVQARRHLVDLPGNYELMRNKKLIQHIIEQYHFPEPLRVLAPHYADRRNSNLISCATRPYRLPSKAFVELTRFKIFGTDQICHVLIATPEMCFLQAAKQCSYYELIKLGFDLCNIYMLDSTAPNMQRRRTAAVNTSMLRNFLTDASGIYGTGSALKALRCVLDNSNSPMETKLAMMQTIPFLRGGFSIDGQELNAEIEFSTEAEAIFRRRSCNGDTVWRKEKVVLEYDSNQFHLSTGQHDWDKRKTSALTLDGYRMFPVTAKMVSTEEEIEKTFLALRKMLGKRTSLERIRETADKRHELFEFLFKKKSSVL